MARKKTVDITSMGTVERVVVAQAIINAMKLIADSKAAPREEMDRMYRTLFEQTGSKTFDVRFDGEKVGTYSIRTAKGTPDQVVSRFVVSDEDALRADTDEDFADYITNVWLPANLDKAAEDFFYAVGAMPDGCEVVQDVIPGERAGQYLGGALKITEPGVVLTRSLGTNAKTTFMHLLKDGDAE